VIEMAFAPATGQISLSEARFLGELVRGLTGEGPIVEIGTLFGWSTRVMVLHKSPDRELVTVDNFTWNPLGLSPDAHYRCTAKVLDDAINHHRVRIVRQDKSLFYESYSGLPPALVFLDAIHTKDETAADIAWAKKVNAGCICVHDYKSEFPGVVEAVDEAGGPVRLVESLAQLH